MRFYFLFEYYTNFIRNSVLSIMVLTIFNKLNRWTMVLGETVRIKFWGCTLCNTQNNRNAIDIKVPLKVLRVLRFFWWYYRVNCCIKILFFKESYIWNKTSYKNIVFHNFFIRNSLWQLGSTKRKLKSAPTVFCFVKRVRDSQSI